MSSSSLADARAAYAEKIRGLAALRSESLAAALAAVPREEFLGPGPWKLLVPTDLARGYRDTPDADPRHLYDNVLVAIDPERRLNNGEPAGLLRWLDSLELRAGERFLHVGCGVGYYTAIAAAALRPGGAATGVEIDPALAERARRNTASWPDVEIVSGDGSKLAGRGFDAIFVNAGVTEIAPIWLDSLAPEGWMLLVRREPQSYSAEFSTPVGVYHCAGARSEAGEQRLRRLFAGGVTAGRRRLRRDAHTEDAGCALHGDGFCLSQP